MCAEGVRQGSDAERMLRAHSLSGSSVYQLGLASRRYRSPADCSVVFVVTE
jgi:hypothetical protein